MDHENHVMSCGQPQKMPIKSQRLRNPFLLKIDSESLKVDNYTDGITLNIVCECSFWLFSFWAVKIKEFHEKLAYDWLTIRNLLIDNKFNQDHFAYYSNDPELYQNEYSKIIHKINAPDQFDSKFFTSNPRDRYPLAIILLLNDRELEEQLHNNDIVMMASIIHLKDSLVPLSSSVIGQYIKRKSGIVLNLQDLYICSEQSNEDHMPNCIICLDNHITRAILPCRHACVCSNCFDQINTCPLCRSPIQNFIMINQPIQTEMSSDEGDNNNNQQSENLHDNNRPKESFVHKIQKFFGF
ncbi:cytochrome b-c1 complex subunit Rieske, mitochondrial-like protein [Euroglyphus maynei]|uniref:Cytochrome b-c1 complex subunit Rieske, mitochondrial-like protein n=1 Tax=Euroglyphus maynei TaxID=6958 RepID=A0A1Y3BRH7_EURMA|nr:cytochrome b-c1 complex subunit Rieske, mitochondrial-like protein [Euroglyphus maynei]